jgi:hypothetical protein
VPQTTVSRIFLNEQVRVDTMLLEEHGLLLDGPEPKKSAWWTFIAFLVVGIVPIAPFIVNLIVDGGISAPFLWNSIAMAVTFSQSKCSNRGSSVAAASKPDRNRSQSVQWLPSLLTESVGCSEALPTVSRSALRTLL